MMTASGIFFSLLCLAGCLWVASDPQGDDQIARCALSQALWLGALVIALFFVGAAFAAAIFVCTMATLELWGRVQRYQEGLIKAFRNL